MADDLRGLRLEAARISRPEWRIEPNPTGAIITYPDGAAVEVTMDELSLLINQPHARVTRTGWP